MIYLFRVREKTCRELGTNKRHKDTHSVEICTCAADLPFTTYFKQVISKSQFLLHFSDNYKNIKDEIKETSQENENGRGRDTLVS